MLFVSFDLENLTAGDLCFEYRFEWVDAEGLRIETSDRSWTPIAIPAAASVPVRAVAPDKGATRWTLLVRFPGDAVGR